MSILGPVSNTTGFLSWFGLVPSKTSVTAAYGDFLSEVAESPWLTQTEKERVESLLLSGSLVIPPPQINIAAFQDIALNFSNHFSIGPFLEAAALTGFGVVESAVTLAAVGAWSEAQSLGEQDLVEALASGEGQNPFDIALRKYLQNGSITAVDALRANLLLRKLLTLQAALKTASPDLLMKAFMLAQQQMILAMLQNWSASQAEIASTQQESEQKKEIERDEIERQILSDYIVHSEQNQTTLAQASVAMLIGSIVVDSGIISIVKSVSPFSGITEAIAISVPPVLKTSLDIMATGVISAALMWAAPMAMTLVSFDPGTSELEITRESSKAFATALATLVTNPGFDALLTMTLDKAVARGLITQSRAETISASFKASLLLMAMAVLYKSETGGLTVIELKALVTGQMRVDPNDFLGTLAKLVNEQLQSVPEAEREAALNALLAPFEDNPSIDELVSPLTAFIGGWNPACIRDASLASPG
jgi:hypothetical protein